MPKNATWRKKATRKSKKLFQILTLYRDHKEIADVEHLLNHCPDVDRAILQWARANVPNVAIGGHVIEELGLNDPSVRKWLDNKKRNRARNRIREYARQADCADSATTS